MRATEAAQADINALRGKDRESVDSAITDLAGGGCRQAGIRLLGRDGSWSRFCSRRANGPLRIITTCIPAGATDDEFAQLADDERLVALIVEVGEHDDEVFYRGLSEEYEIAPVGQHRDDRPRCCGPAGWPSLGELPTRTRRTTSSRRRKAR